MDPESEELMGDALCDNIGTRISFNCDQVTYIGIVGSVLPESKTVRLKHAKIIDNDGKDHYQGSLRFKFYEIASFKIVETAESVNKYPRNEYLLNILKNSRPVDSRAVLKALFDNLSDDDDDDVDFQDEKINDDGKPKIFSLDVPVHLEKKLPKDFFIIKTFSENFYKAIDCIIMEKLVGVSLHGHKISRFNEISLLCMSTKTSSYVFDIQQLGKKAFQEGLKQILESDSVKKVIYDCRFPSDCLAHQYNIKLSNVFDIRVADLYISKQRYNEEVKFVSWRSLDSCLRVYLKVPQEYIYKRETYEPTANLESFFRKRPISNEYLYDILKSVMYLILLYEELSRKILKPVSRASVLYKDVLSGSSQGIIDFLGKDLSSPDAVTWSIIMNGIQTAYFRKSVKIDKLVCRFIDPRTGKVIGSNETSSPTEETNSEKSNKDTSFEEKHQINQSLNDEEFNPLDDTESVAEKYENLSFRQLDEIYHKLVYENWRKENCRNEAFSGDDYVPDQKEKQSLSAKSMSSTSTSFEEKHQNKYCKTLDNKEFNRLDNAASKILNDHAETYAEYLQNPSLRKLDDVYHRLVYEKYLSENVVNEETSRDNVPDEIKTGYSSDSSEYDVWSNLRAEFSKLERAYPEGIRKIEYIPG